MPRQRPVVAGFTADGPALVAILDVLGDLYDLLDERLTPAEQAQPDGDGAVRLTEPAAPHPAGVPLSEPATTTPAAPEPGAALDGPPPRAGRGSSLPAWQDWARQAGVTVDNDMTRDQIIDACDTAGVLSM